MIGAETSYTSSGYFSDMEKGVAGQYHLKTREQKLFRKEVLLLEPHRMQR